MRGNGRQRPLRHLGAIKNDSAPRPARTDRSRPGAICCWEVCRSGSRPTPLPAGTLFTPLQTGCQYVRAAVRLSWHIPIGVSVWMGVSSRNVGTFRGESILSIFQRCQRSRRPATTRRSSTSVCRILQPFHVKPRLGSSAEAGMCQMAAPAAAPPVLVQRKRLSDERVESTV